MPVITCEKYLYSVFRLTKAGSLIFVSSFKTEGSAKNFGASSSAYEYPNDKILVLKFRVEF